MSSSMTAISIFMSLLMKHMDLVNNGRHKAEGSAKAL